MGVTNIQAAAYNGAPAVYSPESKFNVVYLHAQYQIFPVPTLEPLHQRSNADLFHAVLNLECSETEVLIDINLRNSI